MTKHLLAILAILACCLAGTSLKAAQALPDMAPIADQSRSYVHGWYLDRNTQPGRVLMRLSTAMGNRGTGALELFGGPVSGSAQQVYQRIYDSNGTYQDRLAGNFVYHPTHGHLHMEGFAIYNLRTINPSGGVGSIIAAGAKTSFCLINVTQYWPVLTSTALVPHGRGGSNCGQVQGISSGYADVYGANLTDQWIDVTNVPSGTYWLEVIADPNNAIVESNESNNVVRIQANYINPVTPPQNRAPVVTSPGPQSSIRGSTVALNITASDPDGNPLTFSATGLPLGLAIHSSTGAITGTVSAAAAANYTTVIIASDGQLQGSVSFAWNTTAPLTGAGLRGQYYSGASLGSLVFTRTDPLLDFNWGTGSPDPRLAGDNFSIRWSGKVIPPSSGTHTFIATTDDGVRLWVNGQQIINQWAAGGLATRSGNIILPGGQEADIVIERFESTGSAEFHLSWSGPGYAQQLIPTNRMIPAIGNEAPTIFNPGSQSGVAGTTTSLPVNATDPNGDTIAYTASGLPAGLSINSSTGVISGTFSTAGGFNCTVTASDGSLSASASFTWTVTATETGSGLHAEYFNDRDLANEVAHRVDPVVDFNWGTDAPASGMNADNFSMRWNGELLPQFSQAYTFKVVCDGGARLWVNNMPMFFNWEPTGSVQMLTATWNLTAGQRTAIRLEYNDTTGNASVRLLWSSASQPEQVIPASRLFPTEYEPPHDTTPPSVTLTTPSANVTASFPVIAAFSESVLDLTAADFVVTNGTATLASTTNEHTLSVIPLAAGTVTVHLPAGRAFDAAGNGNTASNTLSVIYSPPSSGSLTGRDIGSPGAAGSTSLAGGIYTVRGSGTDIYNSSDSFHFSHASVTGDGEIIARVASLTNTASWAKAGVMIRESLAADSRNAIMYVPPYESGNISEMMWRQSTGGSTVYFDGQPQNAPPNNWVRLVRSGNTVTGYFSANGTSWTQVQSVTFASLPATVHFGLAVCSVSDGQLATATFDNVRIVNTPPPPGPIVLAGRDIGPVGLAGSTSLAGGVHTVRGSGMDIYYFSDSFHFASAGIAGDGEIVARVTSLTNTASWAKAGVMIRESLAADSRNAIMYVPPYESGNISEMMWRQSTGGSTVYFDGQPQNAPPNNWVRLVRSGNTVTGYFSANGTSWTQVQSVTFASLPATAHFGLAVCSVNNGQLATATFDNVRITGSPGSPSSLTAENSLASLSNTGSGPAVAAPSLAATAIPGGGTGLSFTRSSGAASRHELQIIGDLAQSPGGWSTARQQPVVVPNGDGTETVTYSGIAAEFPGASQGFARLRIEADLDGDGFAESVTTGETFGFTNRTFTAGTASFGSGFARPELLRAVVTETSAGRIMLGASLPALSPGQPVYVEVIRGANEGHRFDIDEAASHRSTLAIDTAAKTNTLAALPASLIGDTIVIRPHHTVDALFPAAAFTAGSSANTADQLRFFTGSSFETLWLLRKPDGSRQWTRTGDASLANAGSRIVDVAEGALVQIRGPAVSLNASGIVRANRIALPLKPGAQLIANPWPAAMSPASLGMTAASGFIGSRSQSGADRLQFWKGDTMPAASGYDTIYLLSAGGLTQWVSIADASLANLNEAAIVAPMRAVFVNAVVAKPAFSPPLMWRP